MIVKDIIVIEDQLSHAEDLAKDIGELFPDAQIKIYTEGESAVAVLRKDSLPQIVIMDCCDTRFMGFDQENGFNNAELIVDWYKKNAPNASLPKLIFTSIDSSISFRTRDNAKKHLGVDAYATQSQEMSLVQSLINKERLSTREKNVETTGLRQIVNETLNLDLPITPTQIQNYQLENNLYDRETMIEFVENGLLDRDTILESMKKDVLDIIHGGYKKYLEVKGKYHEVYQNASHFSEMIGDPAQGYAAFSLDEVEMLHAQEKPAILFMEEYNAKIIPHLKKMSGVVFLNNNQQGHMRQLLEPHEICAVLGQRDIAGEYPFLKEMDGTPIAKTHDIYNGVYTSFSYELLRAAIRHAASYKTCIKDMPEIRLDTRELRKVTIASGDKITLSSSEIILGHHKIRNDHSISRDEQALLEHVQPWLAGWHKDRNLKLMQFKANIDFSEQSSEHAFGVGLTRTEHLILEKPEHKNAFTTCVLEQSDQAFNDFNTHQNESMTDLFGEHSFTSNKDFTIRIRLVDAPPSEFFSPDELDVIQNKYGDRNIRGIQLAKKVPRLYDTQLDGIFSAFQQKRALHFKDCKEQKFYSNSPIENPLEIMIPMIRNEDELVFAKALVSEAAKRHGLENHDYKFGSMLETKEACQNIATLVPHCDFISIGSNDLTSELLNCDRADWVKRYEYTHNMGKDPFIKIVPIVIETLKETLDIARAIKPDLRIDLCGEHAKDIESLVALVPLNLDGVSMTPNRKYLEGNQVAYAYASFDYHKQSLKLS